MANRRELLTSIGALAAGYFTASTVRGEPSGLFAVNDPNDPAANVADRTSTIKLTRLAATPVAHKVFLKLETNPAVLPKEGTPVKLILEVGK